MSRNFLHEACEKCRDCQACSSAEYEEHREGARDRLKLMEQQALRAKGRPDWRLLERLRRAGNQCVYRCDRQKPIIAEILNVGV